MNRPAILEELSKKRTPVFFTVRPDGYLEEMEEPNADRALRWEVWIVSGDQYLYAERQTIHDAWSPVLLGEWSLLEGTGLHADTTPIKSLGDLTSLVAALARECKKGIYKKKQLHPALLPLWPSEQNEPEPPVPQISFSVATRVLTIQADQGWRDSTLLTLILDILDRLGPRIGNAVLEELQVIAAGENIMSEECEEGWDEE